jgi:hypothetical protein
VTAIHASAAATKPPRRLGWIAGVAGVAIAATVGAVVWQTRSQPPAPPAPHARIDEPAARTAPIAAPGSAAAAPTIAPGSAAAVDPKPADPKPADPKLAKSHPKTVAKPASAHDPDPAPPAATEASADLDDDVPRKLHEATAALDHQSFDLAERLANSIINSPAGPKARATARLIHGQVQCIARNDQEAAQIDVRSLEAFRALQIRLLNVCRKHGVVLTP